MTAPVRSTTPAATDPYRTRQRLLAIVLVGVLAAAVLMIATTGDHSPAATTATPPTPLVVGDGRTVTLINLGGRDADDVLARVAEDIAPAVSAVESFWGTDWAHEILVVATGSDQQLAEQAGARQRSDTAALAVADYVDVARGTATGQRIVLAPAAVAMDARDLATVLGHELFHYAARAGTAPDAPRWLTEGTADYVARPDADEAPAILAVGRPTALPSDTDFTGNAVELSAAYDRTWLFARYVADRYGPPMLRALYERACGAGHRDVSAALPQVLGASSAEVLSGWREWLAQRAVAITRSSNRPG